MRHFLFFDDETGEQFIVGENTQTAAVENERAFFDNPKYLDERRHL